MSLECEENPILLSIEMKQVQMKENGYIEDSHNLIPTSTQRMLKETLWIVPLLFRVKEYYSYCRKYNQIHLNVQQLGTS